MSTDMGALPIRVALVAVGDNNPQHTRALDLFDDSWRKLDVRELLSRDPTAGGVGHTENGMSPTTRIAVFFYARVCQVRRRRISQDHR